MLGDLIVAFNGFSVVGLSHKDMAKKMKASTDMVQLKILRMKGGGDNGDRSFQKLDEQLTGNDELSFPHPLEEDTTTAPDPSHNIKPTLDPIDIPKEVRRPIIKLSSVTTLDAHSTMSSENGQALPMSPTAS